MNKWKFLGAFIGMVLMSAPALAQEFDPGYGPDPNATSQMVPASSYGGQRPPQRGRGGGDVDVVLHVDLDRLLGAPQNQRGQYQQRGFVPMQVMPTWQPPPQYYGYSNQQGGYYVPQAGWSGPLPQNEPPKCYNRYGVHYCAQQFMQ